MPVTSLSDIPSNVSTIKVLLCCTVQVCRMHSAILQVVYNCNHNRS